MRTSAALTSTPLPRRSARRAGRPPRAAARAAARLWARRLDGQLAAGAASWRSPRHAARALQLTAPRSRRALAAALEELLEEAELPRAAARWAAIEPCREQVRAARAPILAIAVRLRDGAPVRANGVARLRLLLSDGLGPCFVAGEPGELVRALDAVARRLDIGER